MIALNDIHNNNKSDALDINDESVIQEKVHNKTLWSAV